MDEGREGPEAGREGKEGRRKKNFSGVVGGRFKFSSQKRTATSQLVPDLSVREGLDLLEHREGSLPHTRMSS